MAVDFSQYTYCLMDSLIHFYELEFSATRSQTKQNQTRSDKSNVYIFRENVETLHFIEDVTKTLVTLATHQERNVQMSQQQLKSLKVVGSRSETIVKHEMHISFAQPTRFTHSILQTLRITQISRGAIC